MSRRKRYEPQEISIDSLSHDGRGVGRDANGKVTFIDFALPGERVLYQPRRGRKDFGLGTTMEVLEAADSRIPAKCEYFGTCGGCSLQHLASDAQIAAKQEQLIQSLSKIGKVEPLQIMPPLQRDNWGYRRKARLGVRDVPKKGGVLVGFRERGSSYVTDMDSCEVLHPEIERCLSPLRDVIGQLSVRARMPQVEVAQGDDSIVLVLRHLDLLTGKDRQMLSDFARAQRVAVYLQPGNLESIHPLYPEQGVELAYRLKESSIKLVFEATDFIQVNGKINEALVNLVLELLAPSPDETVLDLFCGLGNFTLPLARSGAMVTGVEGDNALVNQAIANARINDIDNVSFHLGDLFDEGLEYVWARSEYDKVLLDPPRSGAIEMCREMLRFQPKRIVYVSCNPATLARDSDFLVNEAGYSLKMAGVVDMFPHTGHVESIAVFE